MTDKESGLSARARLDKSLLSLQEDLLRLGEHVDGAILHSMQALRDRDEALAEQVVEGDAQLNELRFKVEETCLGMIATQQPAARDLRAIVAALNIVSDLERMGDHAAGNAKLVLRIPGEGSIELPTNLTQMADIVLEMLRRALKAYANCDNEDAYAVASRDDIIDRHYKALFGELVSIMVQGEGMTRTGLYLMFAGHNLERIADRVTNIAERVIFMNSGTMQELNPEPDETATN